ncbi:MAG: UDP-N-acetylmuramoyl-L-alanine--D-glutamate ligase [Proteobacteria bacterium]|nr:UDP-N-acetylmuramoyl-L-alanine--D-glutamate ligase [Pseudomonadota bacterium]
MDMRQPHFSMLPAPKAVPLAGKRVLILGMGDSGLSAANWVKAQGGAARVADSRRSPPRAGEFAGCETIAGRLDASLLDGVDLVCKSPGLALSGPVVGEALARGIPVLGDIELFAWHVRAHSQSKVLAVTGTNGKTTVAALAGHLLRSAGIDCEVAGNIGPAALEALLGRGGRPPAAWVLELSSYQLETTWSLAPDAAAMLNLTEDHLDRYAGLADYAAAKARVFQGAGLQVLNRCDSASMAMLRDSRPQATFGMDPPAMPEDLGLIADGGREWLACGAQRILAADELPLHGRHNVFNALAACALAQAGGAPRAALAAGLRTFRGLPHRVERIAEARGVAWVDDSKGTNVGATIAALNGMGRRTVLIAGGDGKGQDFKPLAAPVKAHARAALLIGRDAPLIEAALKETGVAIERCRTLQAAVKRAAELAQPGDAVLLSPACASFDMFRDYAHRGQVYAEAVMDAVKERTRG